MVRQTLQLVRTVSGARGPTIMANRDRKNSAVPGPRLPAMKFEAKVLCVA